MVLLVEKVVAVVACPSLSCGVSQRRVPSRLSSTECGLGLSHRMRTNFTGNRLCSHDGLSSSVFHNFHFSERGTLTTVQRSTVCAAGAKTKPLAPGVAPGADSSKIKPLTIKDAQIVAEPPQNNTMRIRVDVNGSDTQRAFDTVLRDLAKNAPPVPGFRKAKGGKTSLVPLNVIYQLMGPTLVRKFVIEEIIKATLNDYVGKEGLKAKNQLKTDQTSDELDAIFEPGKDFGFNATLELEEEDSSAEATREAEAVVTEPAT